MGALTAKLCLIHTHSCRYFARPCWPRYTSQLHHPKQYDKSSRQLQRNDRLRFAGLAIVLLRLTGAQSNGRPAIVAADQQLAYGRQPKALVNKGYKVLLIDFDGQGNLTKAVKSNISSISLC